MNTLTLKQQWATEDVNSLHDEIMNKWDKELQDEYYIQEAELASHDTVWGNTDHDADFSEESFDELLFLWRSWTNNKSDSIESMLQIELLKQEFKDRIKNN